MRLRVFGAASGGVVLGLLVGVWLDRPSPLDRSRLAEPTTRAALPARNPPDCPACPDPQCPEDQIGRNAPPVEVREPFPESAPGADDRPYPWPDGLPEDLTAEAQRRALKELADECGFGVDLREIDCSGPPCMAVVLTDEGVEPPQVMCPAWRERFGPYTSTSNRTVLCDDGTRRRLQYVGPSMGLATYFPEDPDDPYASRRIFESRVLAAMERAGCARPGTLSVANRVGYKLQWIPE